MEFEIPELFMALMKESMTKKSGSEITINAFFHTTNNAPVNIFLKQGYTKSQPFEEADAKEILEKELPKILQTDPARHLLQKLIDAGMLDEEWQPVNLTKPEQAILAKVVCERLAIKEVWQVFSKLWNIPAETFRSYFNRAMDQRKSLEFQERLKNILN